MIINFKNNSNIVDGIGFRISQKITLVDVVRKYGEPTALWVTPDGIPEIPYTSMCVFIGNSKIRLDLGRQKGITFLLEELSTVTNIVYYSEPNAGMYGLIQDWQGYGEYTQNYSGN